MKSEKSAGDVLDTFHALELLDEEFELVEVVDLNGKVAREESVLGGLDVDATENDVLFLGNDTGDVGYDADVVVTNDSKGDGIEAAALPCPTCWDDAIGKVLTEALGVRTVLAVDLDAPTRCDKAKDIVTINRVAALGKGELHTFHVLVNHQHVLVLGVLRIEVLHKFLGRMSGDVLKLVVLTLLHLHILVNEGVDIEHFL